MVLYNSVETHGHSHAEDDPNPLRLEEDVIERVSKVACICIFSLGVWLIVNALQARRQTHPYYVEVHIVSDYAQVCTYLQ